MTFIVATNIIASWPPERQPTGTPHTRAKIPKHTYEKVYRLKLVLVSQIGELISNSLAFLKEHLILLRTGLPVEVLA